MPLALLAVPALTLLWWPQNGDQALFAVGGEVLARGDVYWRDFWDVKQPGIYWLYAAPERLGLGVLGVRLLEIALALVAGLVVLALADDWKLRPAIRRVAPLLVVGPYLIAAQANGVGQVEGLVTLPLLLALLAARRCARPATGNPGTGEPGRGAAGLGWAVVLGLAASATAALKLIYLPLALVAAAAAWLDVVPAGERRRLLRPALVSLGTLVVAALAVAGYAVAHGIGGLAWWSTVVAPREVLATGLEDPAALLAAAKELVVASSLTGPPAVVAVALAWRRRHERPPTRELGLLGWLAVAALLALPQFPTTYRPLVLVPPLGLLAVLGLDAVASWAPRRPARDRRLAVAALVVLALPLLWSPARLAAGLVRVGPSGWSLADPARLAVGDALGGSPMVGRAALVRDRIAPGTAIYVFGDPVVYRVLDARQAIEMNGWGPEIMSPRMWDEVARELRRSRPAWVFVQQEYAGYVDRHPAVTEVLSGYTAVSPAGAGGTWWHTDSPGPDVPTEDGNRLVG